jgi:hypothetical protein
MFRLAITIFFIFVCNFQFPESAKSQIGGPPDELERFKDEPFDCPFSSSESTHCNGRTCQVGYRPPGGSGWFPELPPGAENWETGLMCNLNSVIYVDTTNLPNVVHVGPEPEPLIGKKNKLFLGKYACGYSTPCSCEHEGAALNGSCSDGNGDPVPMIQMDQFVATGDACPEGN